MLDFLKINMFSNISILIIIIMFFFCLYLQIKNKKLKSEIEDLKLEKKQVFNRNKEIKEDIIPINNISKEIKEEEKKEQVKEVVKKKEETPKNNQTAKNIKQNNNKKETSKNKIELYQNLNYHNKVQDKYLEQKKQVYAKNVLHNTPKITSPVSLCKEQNDKQDFNLNEFIPKEKSKGNISKEKIQDNKYNYLNEISKQMAEELKPQTIELTDYEKDEEENAIISYQELLNVRDKISAKDNEDETIDFIEELKKLRNSLN